MKRSFKNMLKQRKQKGAIFIQAMMFIVFIAIIVSLTGDLHRGWTIINELNKSADLAASTLVSGNYKTSGEQADAIKNLLVGQTQYITNFDQVTIEWLNSAGEVISKEPPSKELTLYEDPSQAIPSAPGTLLSAIRVSLEYPVGSKPPFPNGTMRMLNGGKEIPLFATGEASYVKKAPNKHFQVRVRTLQTGEFLPICARSDGNNYPFANKAYFWNAMCQEAAKITEPNDYSFYVASGLSDGTIGLQEGIRINIAADTETSFGVPSSEIISQTPGFGGFIFPSINRISGGFLDQCAPTIPGSQNGAEIIKTVSCYPRIQVGDSFIAPAIPDMRYVIINLDNVANPGILQAYSDEEKACPTVLDDTCCTNTCPNN